MKARTIATVLAILTMWSAWTSLLYSHHRVDDSSDCRKSMSDSLYRVNLKRQIGDDGPTIAFLARRLNDTVVVCAQFDQLVLSVIQRSGGWGPQSVDSVIQKLLLESPFELDSTDPIFKLNSGSSFIAADSIDLSIPYSTLLSFVDSNCEANFEHVTRSTFFTMMYAFTARRFILKPLFWKTGYKVYGGQFEFEP